VPWLDRDLYVAADGTSTDLGVDDVRDAVPYRGGYVATYAGDDGVTHVARLDGDQRVVWDRCGIEELARSTNSALVAWFAYHRCPFSRGALVVSGTDAAAEDTAVPAQVTSVDRPLGFVGDELVYGASRDDDLYRVRAGAGPDPVVERVPGPSMSGPVLHGGVDAENGRVAGQSFDALGTPAVVVDLGSGEELWREPRMTLGPFSPDGRHLLAEDDVLTHGQGSPAIVDAESGEYVARVDVPDGVSVTDYAWEDATHALLVVVGDSGQAVLRVDLDGAISRASEIAPYDQDEGPRLWLAAGS
jgi:hypothetical protein